MQFDLTVLGSSSALPAYGRHPSSQFLQVYNGHYLIDCGEGTQMQLDAFKCKRSKINHIFISHLHGDHLFGLLPLLTTFSLLGRVKVLHIYGPDPLSNYLHTVLNILSVQLPYPIEVHRLSNKEPRQILSDKYVTVWSFPLAHRVPTCGFYFKEKPKPPNILPAQLEKYQVELSQIPAIRRGEAVQNIHGKWIEADRLSRPSAIPRSYMYCSDTSYDAGIADHFSSVDLLYHEATFASSLADRAEKTGHSTARQAAQMANHLGAKELLIGHFSTRYPDLTPLLKEAREVFANTKLAIEGVTFSVPQSTES